FGVLDLRVLLEQVVPAGVLHFPGRAGPAVLLGPVAVVGPALAADEAALPQGFHHGLAVATVLVAEHVAFFAARAVERLREAARPALLPLVIEIAHGNLGALEVVDATTVAVAFAVADGLLVGREVSAAVHLLAGFPQRHGGFPIPAAQDVR